MPILNASETFDDASYRHQFLQNLSDLRDARRYTDVTLTVDDVTFPCHRVVLSAACPYFHAMFETAGLAESNGAETVRLAGTDAETMRDVVEYLYTGRAPLSAEKAQRLLQAADQFRLEGLRDACEGFMLRQVDATSCIGFYRFAKLFDLQRLKAASRTAMLTGFRDVVAAASEFADLGADELVEYIGDDRLDVESENVVHDAVVRWALAIDDVAGRRAAFEAVVGHVRLPFCTADYLCHVVDGEELARESLRPPKYLVAEALEYHMLPDRQHEMVSPRTVPRASFDVGWRLVLLGGLTKDDRENRLCWFLDNGGGVEDAYSSWHLLAQLPRPNWKFYAACAIAQAGILVSGGYQGSVRSECWLFDTVEKKWKPLPEMAVARCKHAAVAHAGRVFVVGGEDDADRPLDSVERFDCRRRNAAPTAWTPVGRLRKALSDPLAQSCGADVFVVGGIGVGDHASTSTQKYDAVRDEWLRRADMPVACRLGAVAAVNDRIYVVGGHARSCMSYAPATDSWTILARPRERHCNAPAVVWRGRILLAGGDVEGNATTTIVEEYNHERDLWSYWKLTLKEELSCHCLLNVDIQGI